MQVRRKINKYYAFVYGYSESSGRAEDSGNAVLYRRFFSKGDCRNACIARGRMQKADFHGQEATFRGGASLEERSTSPLE